ncbi:MULTISPECIES: septal ring lytic transglycosylase RlpA family protein [unclassified Kaistella]|uniref:septal ring lytic transglycosylase RlpA family protein n=1 Tax=unclassified Kaistella TaxID=2762626 RepID=UPI0027367ABB|nr:MULTISPECIES: septal ring lytic transglycosylase RlpA family protein [unclassified Kaistella]MDP2455078.1 septal ring lytic transglycosylase RlpA family protein [Kaistella sp. SH11-4b]MDP2457986.1 septal ring lytic transglycosylase RlpA family protein [Kaistella sp. SH40-3]MDP2460870.1 septal ring lytic transglycosylase RlpA family protein [Kaistella sp. SH19-2b]
MKMIFSDYKLYRVLFIVLLSISLSSCSANRGNAISYYQSTTVSNYANKFNGKKTASGEVYKHSKMTAAHKTLSFGTEVEIINPENSKKVIVTVNDRGPLKAGRAFDLSQGAFKKLGSMKDGVLKVKYKILR